MYLREMKMRFSIFTQVFLVVTLFSCGSDNNTFESSGTDKDSTAVVGFDWENDPLSVNLNDDLISSMDKVDLDTISAHVYNYFHLQQTGDSAEYVKHFDYYPSMFDEDTMKNAYVEATIKWWNMGYRNVFENIDINYASAWTIEEDQRVALIGFEMLFKTEFTKEYPSDPKRLVETLQRQMPKADIEYVEGEHIKSIVAKDSKGLFVFCPLDKYDFAFISEEEGKRNAMDSLMLRETRLNLLRDKREALK